MNNNAHSPEEGSQNSDTALNQNQMENENATASTSDALNENEVIKSENATETEEQSSEIQNQLNQDDETAVISEETAALQPEKAAEDVTPLQNDMSLQPEPPSDEQEQPAVMPAILTSATEEQFLESHPDIIVHEEEHVEDVIVNYHELSKEELLQHFKDLLNEDNAVSNRNKAFAIRDVFSQIVNNERNAALSKHIEDGGTKEDFEAKPDAMADEFFSLFEQFKKKRTQQIEAQEKQKTDNLAAKQAILLKLRDLIQNEENMQRAYNEFNELQNQWRSTGSVPAANMRDLHMTYKLYVDRFYDFVKINRELQALDQKKNLLQKLQLCEKAEELLLEPSINKAIARIHDYMNTWREIGMVPRDKQQEIWDRFKAAVDKIFEKRREFEAQMQTEHQANLESKKELAIKAEEFSRASYDKHNHWQDALKQVMELQQQFKGIGFASRKENEQVWSRFKTALDTFFRNKNDFYQKRKKELSGNLQLRTELCVQAEALKESNDWKNTANQLKHLQEEWKKIGPVAEKYNQKIWQRFKDACDSFFNQRKSHFENIDKEYESNYSSKLALIEQIEGFQLTDNNSENLEHLKAFQRQFTEIGLVPMSKKDEVHQRFRKAIDALYNKLNMGERDKARMRYDDKIENIKHQPGSKGKLKDEHQFLQNKIKELTGEVTVWQNNIGFFGRSKGADAIKKEFEEKIRKAQEEITALRDKLTALKNAE